MNYLLIFWFAFSFVLAYLSTKIAIKIANKWQIVDLPKLDRKIHNKAKPLLGGLAIYVAIVIAVFLLLLSTDFLVGGEISTNHYIGFLLGGLVLMVGGFFDDKYELPPKYSIFFPAFAAFLAIAWGIEIEKLTNPFGGIIYLESWQSDTLVFVWLMVVMYTTKFLDGLDGLATGISGIGTLMVMLLALTAAYYQPDVALLSAVILGALLGFLYWNYNPAMIFLGEGGSTFVGYSLGILAVISGGKLAIALLVLGIPMMDVFWTILRRWSKNGLRQVFKGDRKHLHHRLLDLGWPQKRIVLTYFLIAGSFGLVALFLQSREKLIAFIILTVLMIIGVLVLVSKENKKVKMLPWSLMVVLIILAILYGANSIDKTHQESCIKFEQTVVMVDVAKTVQEHARGLGGRESLDSNQGMLFLFSEPNIPRFWMRGMNFDLDFIWIRDGQIVDLDREVKKEGFNRLEIISPTKPVDSVLEVNSGFIDNHQLQIGQNAQYLTSCSFY